MDENLSQIYLEELNKSETPDSVLMEFFGKAFNITLTTSIRITFRKLLKMYGRKAVFMGLLDMYDVNDVKAENPYPLLVYFIKKRMETGVIPITYLKADDIESRIAKIKRDHKKMDLSNPMEEID